ncbi:inositol monophosphatase family protein [Alkalibacterium sp. s-m-22]
MTQSENRHALILQWLKEIKSYILQQKNSVLDVEQKTADNDLVTKMDRSIEEQLVEKIRRHFPEDKVVGEEGFGDEVSSMDGTIWFIDPIDGTLNFVKQQENFAVMLAVYEEGEGQAAYVYDITRDKLYSATKGEGVSCNGQRLAEPADLSLREGLIAASSALMMREDKTIIREIGNTSMGVRMLGSAGLESVEVAKGSVVAYVASNLKPWDVAPGLVFMEELGMSAVTFTDEPIDLLTNNDIVFSTKNAHKDIIKMLHA